MRKLHLVLPLLLCLGSPPVHADEQAAVALVEHYRFLEAADYDTARKQIYTDDLRPQEREALPGAMEHLHAELASGGGFGRINITQVTGGDDECVLIGFLILKDGTRKPNAWKMTLSGGAWQVVYSRQVLEKHLKAP